MTAARVLQSGGSYPLIAFLLTRICCFDVALALQTIPKKQCVNSGLISTARWSWKNGGSVQLLLLSNAFDVTTVEKEKCNVIVCRAGSGSSEHSSDRRLFKKLASVLDGIVKSAKSHT